MRVHARGRALPRRALRRSDPQAAAAGRRPDGERDREGAPQRPRPPGPRVARGARSAELAPVAAAGGDFATRRRPAHARRVHRRARGRRSLLRRGRQRDELSTNHPNATGEVTQIALAAGAEARDLDALQYHPNGGAWPDDDAGLRDPRDDPRVRRGAPQRRAARSSRTRSARATRSPRRSSTRSRPGGA